MFGEFNSSVCDSWPQKSQHGYGFTDYSLLLALLVGEILESQIQLNSVSDL